MSSYMCVGEHKSFLTAGRPLVTKCNKSLVSSRAFLNVKRTVINKVAKLDSTCLRSNNILLVVFFYSKNILLFPRRLNSVTAQRKNIWHTQKCFQVAQGPD